VVEGPPGPGRESDPIFADAYQVRASQRVTYVMSVLNTGISAASKGPITFTPRSTHKSRGLPAFEELHQVLELDRLVGIRMEPYHA